MSEVCEALHRLSWKGTRHKFPFDGARLPSDGIYVVFEAGEKCHGGDRIVRVGTHTGKGQLRPRLLQHFVKENKDRSIFRKNIGRALLNSASDPFLAEWQIDRTSRAARKRFGPEVDVAKRLFVEAEVTEYVQGRCTFAVFRVEGKTGRLLLESRMISTLALWRVQAVWQLAGIEFTKESGSGDRTVAYQGTIQEATVLGGH
jgi:hypothetical protein